MALNSREATVFIALRQVATNQRLVGHSLQNGFTSRQRRHTDVTTPIGTAHFTGATLRIVGTTFVASSCDIIIDRGAHGVSRQGIVGGTCGLDACVTTPIGTAELAAGAVTIRSTLLSTCANDIVINRRARETVLRCGYERERGRKGEREREREGEREKERERERERESVCDVWYISICTCVYRCRSY